MKRTLLTKLMLLLCALIVGSGSAWGQASVHTSNVTWSHSNGVVIGSSTYDACKIAKGSSTKVTVPKGTVKLYVHCAAWNKEGHNLSISAPTGVSISPTSWSITADAGVYGSSTNFTLNTSSNATTSYFKEFTLSGVSSDTDITFSCASSKRAVIWGINAVLGHTLNYSATNGSIGGVVYNTSTAVASGASVAEGGKVTLTATPADGYEFDSWEVSGTGSSLSSTSTNPTTFTMGTANSTVTANFVATSGTPTYTLTITPPTGGTITVKDSEDNAVSSGDKFEENAELTLSAAASTGYTFTTWTKTAGTFGSDATTASNTFTMPASAATIGATFTLNTHSLSITSSNGTCATTVNGETWDGSSAIPYGATVVSTATPNSGYQFSSWTCSYNTVTTNGNEISFTMPDADVTLTANYSAIPTHTATFSVNGVTSSQTVAEGAAIPFPADPADISGKKFVGWYTSTYSDVSTAPSFVTSATMSTSDVTYYAVYAEVTGSTDASWTETAIGSLTSSDIFVIVGNNGSTYALPNGAQTSGNPSVSSVSVSGTNLTTTPISDDIKWNITGNSKDGYIFYPNGSTNKWLYLTNNNKGVCVGTGDAKHFKLSNGYLSTSETTSTRYIGIYTSTDWRCYTSTDGNIANQTFAFYKYIAASTTYANYTTDTRPEPGIAYANASVDVKLTSGYTGQALTNTNSVTVTYSSSDKTVATVNSSTGAITELLKAGSTTITATFAGNATYKPAEVSYTLNVTEKTPAGLAYATSEVAKVTTDDAFTNTLTNGNSLTVSYSSSATGVATVNSSTGEVTIKGAGETTITAAFAGNDDYEAGNASYTLTVSKATPTLSFASENAIGREGEAFVGNALTNPASLTVTYSSSDTDVATVNSSTGAVTIVAAGTTTITASFAGNDTYASGSASYTLKVLATPTITVSDDEVAYGETYTYSAGASDTGGDITVTSGNTSIATVAGLVITPVACGEVEITVSRAETDTYKADSQTFTLTVTAPAGSAEVLEDVIASFDFTDNTDWAFPTSETSTTTSYDNGDYEITLAGAHYFQSTNKYLMLKGSTGVLTFPAFDKKVSSIEIVGKSGASASTKENIYVGTKAVSEQTTGSTGTNTFAIDDDYQDIGTIYSLKVTDKNAQITAINVYTKPSSATVTLNKYGYATYCSENPMDFSSTSGYTAWRVSSIDGDEITFAKITEKIKGGQGVLLYNKNADGVNTSSATIKFADGTTEFDEDKNLLVGTTAPTYFVEDSFYGLSGNQFLKNNTCTLPAGKAYLPYDKVNTGSAEIRNFTFVFEDNVTGIETIQNVSDEVIFDMTGRRLNRLQKGVNIVNGKKVLVK